MLLKVSKIIKIY